jgi:hypothetical protein
MKIKFRVPHLSATPFEMDVGCADSHAVQKNIEWTIRNLEDQAIGRIVDRTYRDDHNNVVVVVARTTVLDVERLVNAMSEQLDKFYLLECPK